MHEIIYTEVMIRRAARHTILRTLGPLYLIALLALSSSIGFGILRGSHDWFIGVTATLLAFAILVPLLVWRQHTKASLRRLHELDHGKLSIDILAGRLHLSSALGSTDMPLTRITKVQRFPGYWVFISDKTVLMTLPITALSAEVRQRWLAEFQAVGTQV